MASNFQLLSYRNKDSLHLQLYGDFDGNSAYEFSSTPMTLTNYTLLDLMYFKIIMPSPRNIAALSLSASTNTVLQRK